MLTLYVAADTLIEFSDLQDADGNAISDATLTFSVQDSDGNAVLTDEPMDLVSGSTYRGTVPSTTDLTAGRTYWVLVPVSTGDDNDFRRVRAIAEDRRET